ncbi:MAG TPA: hypothetical protein VLQ91_00375 [Draconibacterium sp.]|nr:hypothetical protein [Draconibacterium sp.]
MGELNIDKNDPPTIIVYGTKDKFVTRENSVHLTKKQNAGVKNELVTIEGGGHTPVAQMDDFKMRIAAFMYRKIR